MTKIKLKTKKAIRKRFKLTSNGSVKCKHSGIRHRLVSKSKQRNRRCFSFSIVSPSDISRVSKHLYYFIK